MRWQFILIILVFVCFAFAGATFVIDYYINSAVSAAAINNFRAGVLCGVMDYVPVVNAPSYKASPICVQSLKEVREYQLITYGGWHD